MALQSSRKLSIRDRNTISLSGPIRDSGGDRLPLSFLLGGVTEWLMVAVLKTVFAFGERGFESHPLRQKNDLLKLQNIKMNSQRTFEQA